MLIVYGSKTKILFGSIVYLLLATGLAIFCVTNIQNNVDIYSIVFFSFFLLFFTMSVIAVIDKALHLKLVNKNIPLVVIDSSGVWDKRVTIKPIEWKYIKNCRLIKHTGTGATELVEVILNDKHLLGAIRRKIDGILFPFRKNLLIHVWGVSCSSEDIYESIKQAINR